ncbi:MAG TPA: hypothetical protein VHF23_06490 [Gaiellaceae bacterium]|nr:hypothetical protein [Gaiellaceae bacterium]
MKQKPALAGAAAAAAVALAFAGRAGGEPPAGGQFVPGESLGGVELGMTRGEVLDTWGARHGVCRDCREEIWYFNERPFRPEGTGVVFEDGRVAHAFTVWQPQGWFTPEGLELGDAVGEVGAAYGELTERACSAYSALVLEHDDAAAVFYVYEDELWGFGLVTPGRSPCL